MRCLGRTKQYKRCKNQCKFIFCSFHKRQWIALISFLSVLITLLWNTINIVSYFNIIQKKDEVQNLSFNPIFQPNDSVNFNVLITRFEGFTTNEDTYCIGRSIQERFGIIDASSVLQTPIKSAYADSILNPKSPAEARLLLKKHNVDLLIYGLVSNVKENCEGVNLYLRYSIDESLFANVKSAIKIDESNHGDKYSYVNPDQIVKGELKINHLSLKNWVGGLVDLKLDNPSKAFLELDSRINDTLLNPTEISTIYRSIGLTYNELKHFKRAIAAFDTAINLNPNDTISYNKKGVALKNLKYYKKAIKAYNKALEIDSTYAPAYSNRGNCYKYLGLNEKALTSFNKAISLDSTNSNFYINRGIQYSNIEKYSDAISDFNTAIKLNPKDPAAYVNRGLTYKRKGAKKAISDYNYALTLDSNYISAYNNRGIIYKNQKKYDLALKDYNKAIKLAQREHTHSFFNRGILHLILKNNNLAINDFDKSIELNPKDFDGYYYRGLAKFKLEKYESAVKDFSKSIFLNDSLAMSYYQRGKSYNGLKIYKKAIKDFDMVINLDSTNSNAYSQKAFAYRKSQNPEKALKDYGKSIELNPRFVNTFNTRGILYLKTGYTDSAIEDFQKVISIDNTFYYGYINLLFAYCIKFWYLLILLSILIISFFKRKRIIALISKRK